MDFVKQCPNTYESRISRFRINNCSTLDSYHCLKTDDNGLREICISPIWMEGDMCPIYTRSGKIGASKCIVQPQLECPTIVYKSSDVFNYTGCLPIMRENSTTKNTYQYMYNSTFTCINGAGVNLQAAYFAVPAFLLFLMLIGNIVLWKRKQIRKRIRCLGICAALYISSIEGSGGGVQVVARGFLVTIKLGDQDFSNQKRGRLPTRLLHTLMLLYKCICP